MKKKILILGSSGMIGNTFLRFFNQKSELKNNVEIHIKNIQKKKALKDFVGLSIRRYLDAKKTKVTATKPPRILLKNIFEVFKKIIW